MQCGCPCADMRFWLQSGAGGVNYTKDSGGVVDNLNDQKKNINYIPVQ